MKVVVDSSVLVAILLKESDFESYEQFLVRSVREILVPAPLFLETLLVLTGRGARSDAPLRRLLDSKNHQIVPFDRDIVPLAYEAFLRFGKGRHPAALNFADCIAYGTAKRLDAPLLFKGDDFRKTDVIAAL